MTVTEPNHVPPQATTDGEYLSQNKNQLTTHEKGITDEKFLPSDHKTKMKDDSTNEDPASLESANT